ncbi:hypothetical protein [Burkholderia multivorans]|uniref:hypothetical protein n=1 Tax=Burkholderia multivorans TaxID=87883 RepID=UPI00158C293E|nr:hypothetical protein [Burkholderia multivorans]MDR8878071.1 hypothetical protein [Burkholderia multivorans]MDR8882431.1 hypothetical protein [Burkholderia multivorans]MDR8889509.1 hypothetical protein [Burkholderia multivorans]MDR8908262.1 hypothetical protein [Burkholderia multivorans]MDR8915072.1 hypothetical protein [Burkholderia multivorans]
MDQPVMKLSCHLEGDSALDFERVAMMLKVSKFAPNRPKQQSTLVSAMLLLTDAVMAEFAQRTGRRYPELAELLESAGVKRADIARLLQEPVDAE